MDLVGLIAAFKGLATQQNKGKNIIDRKRETPARFMPEEIRMLRRITFIAVALTSLRALLLQHRSEIIIALFERGLAFNLAVGRGVHLVALVGLCAGGGRSGSFHPKSGPAATAGAWLLGAPNGPCGLDSVLGLLWFVRGDPGSLVLSLERFHLFHGSNVEWPARDNFFALERQFGFASIMNIHILNNSTLVIRSEHNLNQST